MQEHTTGVCCIEKGCIVRSAIQDAVDGECTIGPPRSVKPITNWSSCECELPLFFLRFTLNIELIMINYKFIIKLKKQQFIKKDNFLELSFLFLPTAPFQDSSR